MKGRFQGARRRVPGEAGFTLAEMLVALLIVGIIFAGAASALMNLSRASVANERRVQATALMTELHESFQAMSWDAALLYPEEVDQLAPLDGYELIDGEPSFEGEPIVLFDGDCDPSEECRWDEVPLPFEIVTVDGRDYEVYRIVTEVDRAGTSEAEIKRLTSIVRFEVLGRWVTQQLNSERAGTSDELGLLSPPGPAFNIVPSTVPVDENGFHTAPIRFDAVFPHEMSPSVQNVTATIQTETGPVTLTPFQPVPLGQLIRRYTLGVADEPEGSPITFATGTQSVTWTYEYQSQPYEATTALTFEGPLEDTLDPGDPIDPDPDGFDGQVQSLTASPGTVRVRRQGGGASTNYFLCDALTITATVVGIDSDPSVGDSVRADYTPDTAATSVNLVSPGGGIYTYIFGKDSRSAWHPPATGTSDTFVVTARGGNQAPGAVSEPKETTVNFQLVGSCPS